MFIINFEIDLIVSIFEPVKFYVSFYIFWMQQFFHISFSGINAFDVLLLTIFGVLLFSRILYLWLVVGRIAFRNNNHSDVKNGEPISLLLTFRNEEKNLQQYLPEILKIKNVDFEVVAVDDFSQDNSLSVLGVMKEENGKLRVSSLNQETRFSEKLAQNIALKAARNNWVMTIPVSLVVGETNWLKNVSGRLIQGNDVVLNYSNVLHTGRFYNRLFRIELFLQQLKSAGFTICGLPFTYTEENVAFRKEKYFEGGSYSHKLKEPFANLELLINAFIRKNKTEVCFQQETAIQKNEQIERSDYFGLLKKSFRIEKYLPASKRWILLFDEWTRLLFIPFLILVIVFVSELWLFMFMVIVVKIVLHLFIIKRIVNHLNERKIFLSSLMYDLIVPYYKVFYRWHFNRRSRKQRWRRNT